MKIKVNIRPFVKKMINQWPNLYWILISHRILTSKIRLMPNFIIIGAQRCGTTSLYNYLIEHPCVAPSFQKEVHFFDNNFRKGIAWYRAHFPTLLYKYYVEKIHKRKLITGEASPYYIFHPHAPRRIKKILPHVKLIILLRNPVDRAFSHYHHEVRLGFETLSFEDAIKKESERLNGEKEKMLQDEDYYSFNYQHYSYLQRGIYIDQIKVWFHLFPRKQILILKSEDFYADPPTTLRQVFRFLNLPNWELREYKKYNYTIYSKMSTTLRNRLIEYFKPYNEQLSEFLGMNFDWNK